MQILSMIYIQIFKLYTFILIRIVVLICSWGADQHRVQGLGQEHPTRPHRPVGLGAL